MLSHTSQSSISLATTNKIFEEIVKGVQDIAMGEINRGTGEISAALVTPLNGTSDVKMSSKSMTERINKIKAIFKSIHERSMQINRKMQEMVLSTESILTGVDETLSASQNNPDNVDGLQELVTRLKTGKGGPRETPTIKKPSEKFPKIWNFSTIKTVIP